MPNEEQQIFKFTAISEAIGFKQTIATIREAVKEINLAQKQLEKQTSIGGANLPKAYSTVGSGTLVGSSYSGSKAQQMMMAQSKQLLLEYKPITTGTQLDFGFGGGVNNAKKGIEQLTRTYEENKVSTEKLSKAKEGLSDRMFKMGLRAAEVIPIWIALRAVYMGLINSIKTSIGFLIDFESAMAQIRLVGKGSEEEYKNLGIALLSLSKSYGVASTEALKAAKIFAQQGLTIQETLAMTRTSMIASIILGEDVESVSESLTSAIKAYNINMDRSISIVDKWMAVQKDFAVTSKDLAEATKVAGATASALGITYDKFLGDVTAIIEVTRKTGSQAGNALQMIYSRLLTVGREAIQTIAQVPVYQNAVGEAVMETTHIFRNARDVMDDVAISWSGLNESQKLNLATLIGSRRQLTPFIALMQNYNKALDAEITSLNSAGEALKDFNILQETTTVKIKQMQNSWLEAVNAIGDTTLIKGTIDSLKNLANMITFLIDRNKALISIHKEYLNEELGMREARESEMLALQKLIELRDRYTKMLEKAPPESRKRIEDLLGRVNTVIGGKEFDENVLNSRIRGRVRTQVEIDMAEESRQLSETESKLRKLRTMQGETSPIYGIRKYQEEKLPQDISQTEETRKRLDDLLNKEVEKRLSIMGIEKEEQSILEEAERLEQKAIEDLKEEQMLLEHKANMLVAQGKSEEDILRWKIKQYETVDILKNSEDARIEKLKLTYQLEEAIANKIKEQSDNLKSSVSGSLTEFLKGTQTINESILNIGNTIRDQLFGNIAEGLTERLFNTTGIGQQYGTMMSGLKEAFSGNTGIKGQIQSAHRTVYSQIVRGHMDGLAAARMGSSTATWSGGNPVTGDLGILSVVGSTSQQGTNWLNSPLGYSNISNRYGVKGGKMGPATRQQTSGMTGGQAVGLGVTSALTGYSQYQSSKAGGIPLAQSVSSGVLTGLGSLGVGMGMSALAAGAAFGPIGWIGLALLAIGMGLGMFGGKKPSSTSVSSQTTENKISSRIDVTNKNLEIINRNLLGLKASVETYILPSSAYFGNKRNIEDQFSLMSTRGFFG